MNRILGKIDLLWHKTNVAMQYPATFHVIESGTYIVTFGRNTLMSHRNDSDRGLYPLFNGQQTPAAQAQQAQNKVEADKRRAEEKKQQEERDREKRLAKPLAS